MANRYGFSEYECKIINEQIKRRFEYRQEFQRLKSDPCMHSRESGFVFEPAIQRFISMKSLQYEHFMPGFRAKFFGLVTIVGPMLLYGYAIYQQRSTKENDIRSGVLRYRDRIFKLI